MVTEVGGWVGVGVCRRVEVGGGADGLEGMGSKRVIGEADCSEIRMQKPVEVS